MRLETPMTAPAKPLKRMDMLSKMVTTTDLGHQVENYNDLYSIAKGYHELNAPKNSVMYTSADLGINR